MTLNSHHKLRASLTPTVRIHPPSVLTLMATATRKPRHSIWLMRAVMSEGYFSKYTQWSYEQEVRLVSPSEYIEDVVGNDILFLPSQSVSAMIVGQRFPEEKADTASEIAISHELELYELQIGKSYPQPFKPRQSGQTKRLNIA